MPQSAKEHGDDEVGILSDLALAVAAKGDVKIVLEPRGEGDVPTVPELRDRGGLVGRVEIDVEVEAKQQGYAYGHVAVAGEVAVYLERVAIDSHQVLDAGVKQGIVEHAVDEVDADVVRDDDLLDQACHYEGYAASHHAVRDNDRTVQLGDEVACTDYGACHELREERDVEGIVEQTADGLYRAAIDINGVAQRLEREERNSDRQEDVERPEGAAGDRRQYVCEEIGVLEIAQQTEVDGNAECHHQATCPVARHKAHAAGNEEIGHRDKGKQEEIRAAALVVEIV